MSDPTTIPAATGGSLARRLLRNPFLWAALTAIIALPIVRIRMSRIPDPPEVIGTLPGFSLRDQDGKTLGSAELAGKVWIANFIFTTCKSICPRLTATMRTLRERFAREKIEVLSVSISVDPENDTPPVLRAYAEKHGTDLPRWRFLTGPEKEVRALIVGGFKAHMGRRAEGSAAGAPRAERSDRGQAVTSDNLIDIAHAPYFVLVDGQGRIRGYYQPTETGIDEVFHRAQHVLRAERRGGR
jgi:protein SCO1/2